MSQRKRTSRRRKQQAQKPEPVQSGRKALLNYLLAFAFGAVITGGVGLLVLPPRADSAPTADVEQADQFSPSSRLSTTGSPKPDSLDELLSLPSEQLAKVDVARMNLLCATGLPGAEALSEATINRYLARLDEWAAKVKFETERHLYRLTDPRYKDHAEHYKHSEARFRAEWLVTVLQRDIGVHYHDGFVPADQSVPPVRTSKEHFIHGLLENEDPRKSFGGNCVSLPVVYAAVGRRLGYPVKLVCSKEHTFCRWEGKDHLNPAWQDRFNFDGAGKGFSIDPDSFYLNWPRKSTPQQAKLCDWLKSLTPSQELALFVAHRGHVLTKVKKDASGALVAFSHATRLWPTSRSPLQEASQAINELWRREAASHPDIYLAQARRSNHLPPQRRQSHTATLAEIQRINELNRREMQRIMMQSRPPQQRVRHQPSTPYGPRVPGRP